MKQFDVEREPVDPGEADQLGGNVGPEAFEPALGVRVGVPQGQANGGVEQAGAEPPRRGRGDDHVRLGKGPAADGELGARFQGVEHPQHLVRSIGQIGICEDHRIAPAARHAGPHRGALAPVALEPVNQVGAGLLGPCPGAVD